MGHVMVSATENDQVLQRIVTTRAPGGDVVYIVATRAPIPQDQPGETNTVAHPYAFDGLGADDPGHDVSSSAGNLFSAICVRRRQASTISSQAG